MKKSVPSITLQSIQLSFCMELRKVICYEDEKEDEQELKKQ